MGLTNIFVHPLQLFSVNITSHEKITHKVEMRACDKNHYSCPLSTLLQRLIYESAPPAFITLAFDRQPAPPPACPPVTQPKTAFVPLKAPRSTSTGGGGGVHVTRQAQVGCHRAEQSEDNAALETVQMNLVSRDFVQSKKYVVSHIYTAYK